MSGHCSIELLPGPRKGYGCIVSSPDPGPGRSEDHTSRGQKAVGSKVTAAYLLTSGGTLAGTQQKHERAAPLHCSSTVKSSYSIYSEHSAPRR